MRKFILITLMMLVALTCVMASAQRQLIPRSVLFGNPDKAQVRISPDDEKLSWLAPVDSVLNIWVCQVDRPEEAAPVTKETRPIRQYQWLPNGRLVYPQDQGGNENWHVMSVNPESGETIDLTPLEKVNARIVKISPKHPDEILVSLNNRDPKYHDVWMVNVVTAERQLVMQNNEGFSAFVADENLKVRIGYRLTDDGAMEVLKIAENGWQPFFIVPKEDFLTCDFLGFDRTGNLLYMLDSRGRDAAAITQIDMTDGLATLIAEANQGDIIGAMIHPTERSIQAVWSNYTRVRWQFLDPAIATDFRYLQTVRDGDIVVNQSLSGQRWVVAYTTDDGPVYFYLYDRGSEATLLFSHQKALEGLPLARMQAFTIKARDGLELVCYLTVPPQFDSDGDGRPDKPVPLVMYVHGGPWRRDVWGYSALHQLFARNGWATMSAQFRTSATGFGKKHVEAGAGQWGAQMHDDIIDGVRWSITQQIADPTKIAIYGASYGGFEVLWAMTHNADGLFACGIDLCGVSNIRTLLESVPPYWAPELAMWRRMTGGDERTEEGQHFLDSRSPLSFARQINRPLLIGQGANDPRVKQSESDQIVNAMKVAGISVCYVVAPDEGHGFARRSNIIGWNALIEAFLFRYLGGYSEPIGGDLQKSTIQIIEGRKLIPGILDEAGK